MLFLPPNEQIWFKFFYLLALLVARAATGATLLDSEVSRRIVFLAVIHAHVGKVGNRYSDIN